MSARALTAADNPSEPPITNVMVLLSLKVVSKSRAKSSLFSCLPSMHIAITVSRPIFLSMASPSSFIIFSHSASDALSGILISGIFMWFTLQNLPRRFVYSAMASARYFSFSFPTDIIFIFIL